jgi:two-component system cell cycle sensor histidine kinase/response regulator CckA
VTLRHLSIKGKLIAVTFLSTGATLLLVAIAFAFYAVHTYRQTLVRQLTTQAEIIGFNSESALVFRDEKSASETLAALRAEPQIAFAGIYTPDGRPFATYVRAERAGKATIPESAVGPVAGLQLSGDSLVLTRLIGPAERPLGTVRLRADLTELREKMIQYGGIAALVFLVSLVAAVGIGSALQKTVSEPVLDLVRTARTVTLEKNYGVRVTVRHHDELGVLGEAFNEMLGQIQRRDAELVHTARTLATEVLERKRADEALGASEERYRLLFETNPQAMWVFDEETLAFLAVNEAAWSHYGYSRDEFLGMTIRDIRPEEDVAPLLALLEKEGRGQQSSGVWRHRKKDGTLIDVEILSHPIVFDGRAAQLVLSVDVTERRHLEEQLRQSQKMEAVGQLAGGIAHDFNNLLTVIIGNVEIQQSMIEAASPLAEPIDEVRKAADRAAALTRQLLAFSRRQVLEPKVLDINALITNLEKMLRRLISEDVKLIAVLDPSIGSMLADAGQLEQIIVNLSVNARDAMPDGGTLTIETANVELDEQYAREHLTVRPGPYVMIAVTDTGNGMGPETQSRIFEPFFTTKGPGKGTGLGLATVYGIVKQSGGSIWIYSEIGRGTTFKIYFPRVQEAVPEKKLPAPGERSNRGSETVLLVEDEPAVRRLSQVVLEAQGYTVVEAASADEALALARTRKGPIHLVLTDVVMPEMGGADLASHVAAFRPETRVLYMSGYTDDAIVRKGLIGEGRHFLQKPFTPTTLAKKVREVLDE